MVAIPSLTGLKLAVRSKPATVDTSIRPSVAVTTPKLAVKSSLKDFGVIAVATAASILLAGNAMAMEALLGSDDGYLVFVPNEFTVAEGEKIVFKNNAAFPHNVVFVDDEIPSGMDISKISMDPGDLLNGSGDTYEVTLTVPGSYRFFCVSHQGTGMVEKLTVQ